MKINLRSIGDFATNSTRHIGRSITGVDKAGKPIGESKTDLTDPKQILMAPASAIHSIKEELFGVLFFVGLIWVVFWGDFVLPIVNLNETFAIFPRRLSGLPGILTMTFLHGNIRHLMSNTLPLIVLLTLLAGSRARSWLIVLCIMFTGGSLLWVFGRGRPHVGASMLVFGLVTFLISSAFIERRVIPMIVAVIVGLLYGTNLIFGILPTSQYVSWDGHLSGAFAGVVVAFWFTQNWLAHEVLGLRERLATLESE